MPPFSSATNPPTIEPTNVDRASTFEAWAPHDGVWTPWAKPVLFAHIDEHDVAGPPLPRPPWANEDALKLVDPAATYRTSAQRPRPTIVVDLPGVESVAAGLALAEIGFRPIPLYTAIPSLASVVPMEDVVGALIRGASELARVTLSASAAPAFLLDARRAGRDEEVRPGQFDNRSVVFPTDFPSSARLRSAGIDAIVLVQESDARPQADLEGSLAALQRDGFPIFLLRADATFAATPLNVRTPGVLERLGMWWERTLLRRRDGGGFGTWKLARPHGG